MSGQEPQPVEEARAQAIEYLGFAAPRRVVVKGEEFLIPTPSIMSRDQKRRYNTLQLALEDLDRWPDTKNDAGEVIQRGYPKVPHRQNGELVEDYDERLTKALLGEEAGERYMAGGGFPTDIGLFWAEANQRLAERQAEDSKSGGSVPHLAAVPSTD